MPYIPQTDRDKFAIAVDELRVATNSHGISNGELNYLITVLGLLYLDRHGRSYNTLSDVVKAMECAKLEFVRRHLAPYEDRKIVEHGDVL